MAGEFAIRPFRFAFRCFHPMNLTIACQPRREQVSGYTGAITFSGTPLLDLVSCIVWSASNSLLVNLRDALSCLRKQLIRSRQDRCVAYSGRLFSRRLAFSTWKCLIADARLLRRCPRGARCLRYSEESNGSIGVDKLDIVRPRLLQRIVRRLRRPPAFLPYSPLRTSRIVRGGIRCRRKDCVGPASHRLARRSFFCLGRLRRARMRRTRPTMQRARR